MTSLLEMTAYAQQGDRDEPEPTRISIGEGIINLDTVVGGLIGFRSEYFDESSYLWKVGDSVYVSFIASKKPGNFRNLIENILGRGFTVKIPTPLGRMQEIVTKNKYERTLEFIEELGEHCEVWVMKP